MHLSNAVSHKIRHDLELLKLLKSADPDDQINRGILLTLNAPKTPENLTSEEKRAELSEQFTDVSVQAGRELAAIEGLRVFNLMKAIGHASVGGTVGAVVKAIELDCVIDGTIGDRPVIRTVSRG